MITETGHFALILALFVALAQTALPLIGAARNNAALMDIARIAARVQFVLIAAAFSALVWAYVTSDFSVLNVAQNSHTDKPLIYKITGVWGNHEGSMLLWIFILALYGFALSFAKNLPPMLQARTLAVQAIISFGFILFILLTSNPFLRLDPPPLNGEGLNPLLQDPGLAFHPPFLYLGYVGFSMSFSFAIAALIEGRVDSVWARYVRPWALAAWCFLTLGIAMGSWWAYYTLGWGGWWYWDPVENASFIPWLAGTALLHSIIVVEKRGALKAWTILLTLITFSFSLIGTFIVRSGVLTSVHSFASDPKRGVFILALLTVLIGAALILFFLRAPAMRTGAVFAPVSREGALLLNNVLLSTAAGSVLLGTLYPLFIDALGLGKISVGPPFFNIIFVPLMTPLVVAMAVGPMLNWKRDDLRGVFQRLKFAAAAAATVTAGTWLIAGGSPKSLAAACGLGLAAWLFAGTLSEFIHRRRQIPHLPRAAYGMFLAHAGLAIVVAGITGSLAWKTEKIQIMHSGESIDISGYHITLQKVETDVPGPNYTATRGDFIVTKNGAFVAEMRPERRVFAVPPQPATNVSIHTDFISDLYAVIGEPDGKGGYVTRFYHNPLVPWIFIGAVVMALGGFMSLAGRWRRQERRDSIPLVARLRQGFGGSGTQSCEAAQQRSGRRVREGRAQQETKAVMIGQARHMLLIPLTAFAILTGFFVWRLVTIERGETPEIVPSALIDKPAPAFNLPPLVSGLPGLKTADLKTRVTLINFFASWCVPCRAEHPVLATLQDIPGLTLAGIDYQDKPDAGRAWLKKNGNPYTALAADDGRIAIDFGLTGTPESYLIDKQGIIRFKQIGPLTPEIVQEKILPLAAELNK